MITKSGTSAVGLALGESLDTEVVAVVGCGGKSSFIASLAREFPNKKVLVTTTTKIMPMNGEDIILCKTLQACAKHKAVRGVQCLGVQNPKNGKLHAMPDEMLAKKTGEYDVVLIEADGSRGLPCKGWLANEPVVPLYSTHTVGIITTLALGKPANGGCVLNLPDFLELTSIAAGDTIDIDTLAKMVCFPRGMFKNNVGAKHVFINRVETPSTFKEAKDLAEAIRRILPQDFVGIFAGTAQENKWETV